jgi:hypothetical protein
MELENTGSLTDPELTNSEKMRDHEKQYYLDPTEELFLLTLHPEKPARPNCEYVIHLATYYGTVVLTTFISVMVQDSLQPQGLLSQAESCASGQVLAGERD